jgi:hypothetical protein
MPTWSLAKRSHPRRPRTTIDLDAPHSRIIQPVPAAETDNSVRPNAYWLRRVALRSLLVAIVLLALAYASDYAVFRYRVSANRQPFDTVSVQHYDAVLNKDGKSELIFDPPAQQTCAHTLFPQGGYTPCWFLSRHAVQETDI